MMKRKLLIAFAVAGALVMPFSAFAAQNETAPKHEKIFFGIDTSTLTAKQKADVDKYSKKIADLQKEFIDKMVQDGTITKEKGDAAKERIDAFYKASQDKGRVYGIPGGHKDDKDGKGGKDGDKPHPGPNKPNAPDNKGGPAT